jgi:diguanylate cyclase (GGDEF)-like protein
VTSLNAALLRVSQPFFAPAAILVAAALLTLVGPDDLLSASAFLPFVILPIGAILSLWFNRGRVFLSLTSLFIAYMGYFVATRDHVDPFAGEAVRSAIAIFIPLNVTLMLALPERGVLHFRSYRWLLLILVETLFTAWVANAGNNTLSGTVWITVFDHWLLKPDPTPFLGDLLFATGIALAVGRIFERQLPLEVGLGSALLAFIMAYSWAESPGGFTIFFSASGLILLLSVLQESHRMAFRDELTSLPGRRMLEEQMLGMGPAFTIAMVDIDHFKKFNDTHGHDVGDQVLRMVGARLADIAGGGRAYRYGGEEFAILFPDKTVEETLPHLENLRTAIANYVLIARTQDRRQAEREREDRRMKSGERSDATSGAAGRSITESESLSVTVSIGVAERNRRLHTPAAVLRAADEALYRAKHAGRNRVNH